MDRIKFWFPLPSKVLMILHGALAIFVFLHVLANAGGYHNGLQWMLIAFIDFPLFLPLTYFLETNKTLNPALTSEAGLNCLYLAYALVFGTFQWWAFGWLLTWLYRRFRRGTQS
jgi:hypothetical protein